MNWTFHGKRVLVLGGGCLLGQACIAQVLEAGLEVVATVASKEGESALATAFPTLPRRLLRLGDPHSVARFVEDPPEVDYVIDLAHSHHEDLLLAMGDEAHDHWIAMGAHRQRVLQAIGRGMLARRFGRLVYVSSTAAAVPAPGQGIYSALKRAGEGLYQGLGIELACRGITTVSLRLGPMPCGRGTSFLARKPELPQVDPQHAAFCILFLLCDQAAAISSPVTMDAGLLQRKYCL